MPCRLGDTAAHDSYTGTMTTPQPYPDPPRNWKRAGKLIGSWVGILALAQGCLMITPEPQSRSVLDEPPAEPTIAVSRYLEDSFRDREDATENQCGDFAGLEPGELRAMADEWGERYDANGSASYLSSDITGTTITAEVEYTYQMPASGLIGTSTTAVHKHEFEATVEEYAAGQWCISSLEYLDPTDDSPVSHIAHYLMYIDHGNTEEANGMECPDATTPRTKLDTIMADIHDIEDDEDGELVVNESDDAEHETGGSRLIIPWKLAGDESGTAYYELRFELDDLDEGYCITEVEIMDLLHD